jgi:hypothetical protein
MCNNKKSDSNQKDKKIQRINHVPAPHRFGCGATFFFGSSIKQEDRRKMPATKKRKVAQEAPVDGSDVNSNASEGAPQAESDSEANSQASEEAPPAEVDTEAAQPAAKKSFKELGIIDSLCDACETMGLSTYNVLN